MNGTSETLGHRLNFVTFVDSSLSFREALKKCRFERIHESAKKRSWAMNQDDDWDGNLRVGVFKSRKDITPKQATILMKKNGYHPAPLHVALAFAKEWPYAQCQAPILVIGTKIRPPGFGCDSFAYLSSDGKERMLWLTDASSDFKIDKEFCYLGVSHIIEDD